MYGVLFSGILVAMIGVFIIRKFTSIEVKPKPLQFKANTIGGICFGIGWGITGACTGPLYSLIGLSISPAIIVLLSAFGGTFIYAISKKYLPH